MEELRKKLYLVLDTETATISQYAQLPEERQKDFALGHPIVYDIGCKSLPVPANAGIGRLFCRKDIPADLPV